MDPIIVVHSSLVTYSSLVTIPTDIFGLVWYSFAVFSLGLNSVIFLLWNGIIAN